MQCQTAALDELFGNPEECFNRYQSAQILLHSLAQKCTHPNDKSLLSKCKLVFYGRARDVFMVVKVTSGDGEMIEMCLFMGIFPSQKFILFFILKY